LVYLTLLTPLLVSKELLFPFVTSKAFYFRIVVELALPFYLYLLVLNKNGRPSFKNPLNILVAAFWAVNLVSALLGVNVTRSLWGNFERMGGVFYLLHLTLLYFYLLFLAQAKGKYFLDFLKLCVFLALGVAIYSLLTVWGMKPLIQDPSLPYRASAFFGNPIYLGTFFVLTVMLTAWFALRAENIQARIFYFVSILFQLGGIYISGTRGAVLGLALGALVALLAYALFSKGKIRLIGVSVFILAVMLFVAIFVFSSNRPEAKAHLRIFDLNDSNTKSRLIQWGTAVKGFKDRPVFGTGPENYYIVAGQYYNPEIAKYDRSWFDKPHNYILEILITNGLLGLFIYLGLVGFSIFALALAFKKSLISLGEFCVLLAGLLAYQIQNLFVFENVSSSLLYYVILAMAAYLWLEAESGAEKPKAALSSFDATLAYVVFVISFCICSYGIYAANIIPISVSKNVNYGYAFSSANPQAAHGYFHEAAAMPFNFDQAETGMKYGNFAVSFAQTNTNKNNASEVLKSLDESAQVLESALGGPPNQPYLLTQLATVYLVKGLQTDQKLDPRALEDVQKAISLAPNRTEARQLLLQIREYQQDWKSALALAQLNLELLPEDGGMLWQVAALNRQTGNQEAAVEFAQQALSKGYQLAGVSQGSWLIDYYNQKLAFGKSIGLYEQLLKNNKLSTNDALGLVKLYLLAGEKAKALELAQKIKALDPGLKDKVDEILKAAK